MTNRTSPKSKTKRGICVFLPHELWDKIDAQRTTSRNKFIEEQLLKQIPISQ